ncbi:MAG: cupin domain-containing protein [Promethearchaeota archaeon]
MIIKELSDIPELNVTVAGSTKTTVKWLITKEDGAHYNATRRFEIQPGGQIGIHQHPEDHHIYVLQGHAKFIDDKGNKKEVKPTDIIYIPPNEPHGTINDGKEPFIFICSIPYL